ncbi:hypothetical protein BDP27DRAFT_647716 [Rhodocollybia butyracea]|uniref:Zn(2)-C6 fungal-type domain-containing protein n=1 Tax=Rhodocollybia butyracea TaxID=206335 RepID=A0A9P5U9L8_9AGAR|nr:hypothetical protein BDP27DRAFT_647716 [Rhodocollybia butyracea]
MPAIPSSLPKSSRRKKHLSPEELKDIEQKRLKGELSCAECRRLKLRCDKSVPCGSCSRRGCDSICPNGTLEAGVGTRFILASTTQLHSKISSMSARIRALEDALAIFQASVSSERHPLLQEELLKIKFGSEVLPSDNTAEFEARGPTLPVSGTAGESSWGSSSTQRPIDTTTLDAFETLTLGEEGEMKYFGRSAGSETLILVGEQLVESSDEEEVHEDDNVEPLEPSTSASFSTLSTSSTPFHVLSPSEDDKDTMPSEIYSLALGDQDPHTLAVSDLLKYLPPRPRADALAHSYIEHGSLFFRAMKREELVDTIMPLMYSNLGAGEAPSVGSPSLPSPHLLATLFFIFALGSFFDLSSSVKQYVSESEMWFELGRKGLVCSRGIRNSSSSPVWENQNISMPLVGGEDDFHRSLGKDRTLAPPSSAEDTIRALGTMSTYCSMSGKKYSRDIAWCLTSLAAKVAQGSGMRERHHCCLLDVLSFYLLIDRDPARWHMDPKMVERRRNLWWEICTADISHSVALGRPPSIHLSFVDCEFPTDEEATKSVETGDEVMGFWRMKYTFAKEGFTPVINTTLTARSPTYNTILDLDRKIRELSLPPGFKPYVSLHEDGPEIYHNSHLALRDFYASQHRTVTMLYLHRSFFAHAMLTHPSNPLLSPFALSFLAAYRAASVIIKAAVHFYDRCPKVVPRCFFLTVHIFSAAVTVGTVVKRSPHSSIARSALTDLGQALDLFEKCSGSSFRNRIACALLRKLKEKSDRIYMEYLASLSSKDSPSSKVTPVLSNTTTPSPNRASSSSSTDNAVSRTELDEENNELALWGGQMRLLKSKKTTKVKEPRKSTSALGSSAPAISHLGSVSAPSRLTPSFHTQAEYLDSSWNDAMDAQMSFDANPNIDLSQLISSTRMNPMGSYPMTSNLTPIAATFSTATQAQDLDVTMIEAPVSNFNSVDFGFGFGDFGLGAGTTGGRGLLVDMALEDIGPVQAAPSETQSVLMEYLSGTADGPSVPFSGEVPYGNVIPNLNPSSANHSSTWVPTANPSISGGAGSESGSDSVTALYNRFLQYLASKQEPQPVGSNLTQSMPATASDLPQVPEFDMFFESLPRPGSLDFSGPSWSSNETQLNSESDEWATFMRDLARAGA